MTAARNASHTPYMTQNTTRRVGEPIISAEELKQLCDKAGLSMEVLAVEVGVSFYTVRSWFGGHRACRGPTAVRVREVAKRARPAP